MFVWCRDNYIKVANKQLENKTVYQDISDLMNKSNIIFKSFYRRKFFTEKKLNYFPNNFKKATNLGKLYLLPKIQKWLYIAPGRLTISNCGT